MVNYISGLVFVILFLLGALITIAIGQTSPAVAGVFALAWLFLDLVVSSAIRLAAQWEKAVVFRLGKFQTIKGPGLFMIVPLVDQLRMVDTRVLAVNIPKQQVITRDNVPVTIDGVLFFRVDNAAEAIIMVQDYRYMIAQYSQTSLRDVIGQLTLDQLLTEREEIAKSIEQHVEKDTKGWGLEVTGLRIQDIDMPEELKKMMSRQASAEREKRATITKAEGDKEAAVNLSLAAKPWRRARVRCSFAPCRPSTAWARRPPTPSSLRCRSKSSKTSTRSKTRCGGEDRRIARQRHRPEEAPFAAHDQPAPARRSAGRDRGAPVSGRELAVRQVSGPWSGKGVRSPTRVNRQNDRSKSPRQPGRA